MGDTFDSKGGEQNIAQGKNAIGKQENNYFCRLLGRIFTSGNQSPAIVAGGNVAVTYGMSPEEAAKLAEKLFAPLLEAKDQQIKALTEAITALSKTGAPAASINDALQALQQGHTAKAQAIFAEVAAAEVSAANEAAGQQHKHNQKAAEAYRRLGALAYMNDTKAALAAYQKAVELDPENAEGWNNLGNVYCTRRELDKAEEMYRKSLEISEALGLKAVTASVYGNLGNVYHERDLAVNEEMYWKDLAFYGDLAVKAEEMYRKSLALYEDLGSKEGMSANYGNLSAMYFIRRKLDKAEEMCRKSLEINQALGRKKNMAQGYANLGHVYYLQGELDKAEAAWKKSLSLYQEIGAMQHPDVKKVQQLLDELAQERASQPAPPAATP